MLARALRHYLRSSFGLDVTAEQMHEWLEQADEAAALLTSGSPADINQLSSAECVVLALAHLDPVPIDVAAASDIVRDYRRAITAAVEADDTVLLRRLREYGSQFQVMLELEVIVGQPFEVILEEDRALNFRRGGWVQIPMSVREARSTHLEFSLRDPNVDIAGFQLTDVSGQEVGLGLLDAVRYTTDTLAVYTAQPERPDRVVADLRLRTVGYVRWSMYVSTAITLSAAICVLIVASDPGFVEKLTLLALPASVVGAIVVAREQTEVATRVIARPRLWLATALVLLWIVSAARVVSLGLAPRIEHAGARVRNAGCRYVLRHYGVLPEDYSCYKAKGISVDTPTKHIF